MILAALVYQTPPLDKTLHPHPQPGFPHSTSSPARSEGSASQTLIISVNFLANLEYLDLRNNELTVLKKLELPKLKHLFMSGNPWTCFIAEQPSNWTFSSLDHGQDMVWLLQPEWIENWIDQEDTFCDKQKINSAQITKHLQRNDSPKLRTGFSLQQFLLLSANTSVSCPASCNCGVAREPKMILKPPFKLSIVCK